MYLLDTDTCIGVLKGRRELITRMRGLPPSAICVCSVVRAELYFGARKSQRVSENLMGLRRFLTPLRSLPFDDRAAEEYGLIRAALELTGKLIGPNDLLIAAIARSNQCMLITHNLREFNRVPGLELEDWLA